MVRMSLMKIPILVEKLINDYFVSSLTMNYRKRNFTFHLIERT